MYVSSVILAYYCKSGFVHPILVASKETGLISWQKWTSIFAVKAALARTTKLSQTQHWRSVFWKKQKKPMRRLEPVVSKMKHTLSSCMCSPLGFDMCSVENEDCHALSNTFGSCVRWHMQGKCVLYYAGTLSVGHTRQGSTLHPSTVLCLGPGNCPISYLLSLSHWESSPSSLFNHVLWSKPSAPHELETKVDLSLWTQNKYIIHLTWLICPIPLVIFPEKDSAMTNGIFWGLEILKLSTQGKKFHVSAT